MPYWRLVLASEPDTPGKLKRVAQTPMIRKDTRTTTLSGRERDRYFVRVGEGEPFYLDVGFVLGTDSVTDSRSLAKADLDGDGDLDLILRTEGPNRKLRVYRNEGPSGPSAEVRFATSRDAASATILVTSGDATTKIPMLIGQGFLAQDPYRQLVPLGEDGKTELKVRWPGGEQVKLDALVPGAIVEVRRYPEAKLSVLTRPAPLVLGGSAVETAPATCDLAALKEDLPEEEAELVEAGEERRPLLLNLWAPWCQPCRKELPLLARFAKQHPEVEVRLLAVDGTPPAIAKMAGKLAPGVKVTRLKSGAVERRGEALRIPTTCFYDTARTLQRGWAMPVGKATLDALAPRPAASETP
ncbi:MAG: thioredoxin domain-containing protein [Deltaproteobacteria bacterium]|nr:thioredoxin domain-containing protein [Deltaproteobacteria bacterium]